MSECLSQILCPVDIGSFLRHYQAREYFHVNRNAPGHYDDLLSANDLDILFQSEHLPAAFVNVVKEGRRYPLEEWSHVVSSVRGDSRLAVPERLFDLYSQGATLVLNRADRVIPSLNSFCRNLTLELGFPAGANVYITPSGAAGFSKHVDDHEVLVAQISGTKHWLLYTENALQAEVDLQPGDLLYLPRGLPHDASTRAGDSIHVTLGLAPIYAFELIKELAALAEGDPGFQQPAPPEFADEEAKRAFETTFLRQLQSLISRANPSDLLERRFRLLVENQARGWLGRLSDLRRIADMTTETTVCRRPGILTAVQTEGKFVAVVFAGKRVLVPRFLEHALGTITGENMFRIGALDGFMDGSGKLKLVAEFVRAGFLRIVTL